MERIELVCLSCLQKLYWKWKLLYFGISWWKC